MNDDELPGQQSFELLGIDADEPAPRHQNRRRVIAGVAVLATSASLAGLGLSSATTSGGGSGLPGVASLTAESTISAAGVAAIVDQAVVDIDATDSYTGEEVAGTGMVLTADGEILTNNHVVEGMTSITATMVVGDKSYKATVLGTDATDDVALLKLDGASGLTTITAGDSSAVTQGTAVAAIGNALGKSGTPTVTTGAITGTGRSITASDDGSSSEQLTGLLETDANIVSGDSGGPLVDSSGQVIGMDTAASESGSSEFNQSSSTITSSNDGYAIPITSALAIAGKIAAGTASSTIVIGTPGFLGLELATTGSAPGGGFGQPGRGFGDGGFGGGTTYGTAYSSGSGLSVAGVVAGSPAAAAGIEAGDTITAVNATSVSTAEGLEALLATTHGGDTVTVAWTDTSGAAHHAEITLVAGPAA